MIIEHLCPTCHTVVNDDNPWHDELCELKVETLKTFETINAQLNLLDALKAQIKILEELNVTSQSNH